MVFFKLKLDKVSSYFIHSKASLSFYGPFVVSHWVTNAISCPLNRLTFSLRSSCTNGKIPHLPRLSVKFPTLRNSSKVKIPTPGEWEGVKCPVVVVGGGRGGAGGEEEGMLRLQIDGCIITFILIGHTIILKLYIRLVM